MNKNDDSANSGQFPLGLWEVEIRRRCKTSLLYEELKPKLSKAHDRTQVIRRLDRFARECKNFEVETEEGLWIAFPVGKTETGFNLWTLKFRPSYQSAA